MFRIFLLAAIALIGWQVVKFVTGGMHFGWESKKPVPASSPSPTPSAREKKTETAVASQGDEPPHEVVILGYYSLPGETQAHVRFPDGYGWLVEGDFFHDWRIKKLLSKGCILTDMAGREFLVRLRFNWPDQPEAPDPGIPDPSTVAQK